MTEIFRHKITGTDWSGPMKCIVRQDEKGAYTGPYGGTVVGELPDGKGMTLKKNGKIVVHRCIGKKLDVATATLTNGKVVEASFKY